MKLFVDRSAGDRRFLPSNRKFENEIDPRYVNYEVPVGGGRRILVRTDFKSQHFSGFQRIVRLALEDRRNESSSVSFCFDNKGRVMRILFEHRDESRKQARLRVLRAGMYKDTRQKAPIWFRNETEYPIVTKNTSQHKTDTAEGIEPYLWNIGLEKLFDNAQQTILEEGFAQQILFLERLFNPRDRYPNLNMYHFKKVFYYMGIAMYPLLLKR